LDLSQYRLAKDIGVPARCINSINKIVKRERVSTTHTALRLERFLKMSVQLWLNLQSHYDLEIMEDGGSAGLAIGMGSQNAGRGLKK
jgi:addiction module HigA family antidote